MREGPEPPIHGEWLEAADLEIQYVLHRTHINALVATLKYSGHEAVLGWLSER
jgi:hypothetical protein